jgi:RHS repeat-associated protein
MIINMNQTYKAINYQYAVGQSLPIYSWGCLNFTLRYSCFTLRSKWGDLEGCSTGMVTDNSSIVSQGFLYAPFGEIISEYTPGWETDRIPKYAFNAKELDEENGMYYYSARYYAPPTFISRDPMFEKYPSISPYTYCANNPMKYVDPTGMDIYKFDGEGYLVKQVKCKLFDVVQVVDGDKIKAQSQFFKYGTIVSHYSGYSKEENKPIDVFRINGNKEGKAIFKFLADNTSVEWSRFSHSTVKGVNLDLSSYEFNTTISTGHDKSHEYSFGNVAETLVNVLHATIFRHDHNHPNGNYKASDVDQSSAEMLELHNKNVVTTVYTKQSQEYNYYMSKSKRYKH